MYNPNEGESFGGRVVRKVSSMARTLLQPRTTKLMEAGLIDTELNVTDKGVEAIYSIAVEKWGAELEAVADATLETKKKK